MPNPKTVPSCSKPPVHNGWIRKSDLDAWLDRHLPVPTQVISNEEYLPIPQTSQQRLLEREIVASAERRAGYLGMDRRQFLRTSCGMALAFAAMNSVFGHFFRLEAAELSDPAAVAENKARFFIFDVQTHQYMHAQTEKLKIDAWKGYSGVGRAKGKQGWRLDDEKLAYPALEYSRKKGIKNICVHKGLPFPGELKWWSPMDVTGAAMDFPDLNFLVYHSGFKGLEDAFPAAEDGFRKTSYIPWVSDICSWQKTNPQVSNIYMEMGSTFAMMVSSSPLLAAYVLGMIIDAFGPDHVLWGTDSIWWGSPQWQIEAFRRLEMPDQLMKRFGWTPLTDDVKRRIFGLNAARVYRVDPEAKRNPMPGDYIEKLRRMYKQSGALAPSNTQYGWVPA